MNPRTHLFVAVLVLLVATPAAAQDDFLKKEAEQRFHEGTALMDQGKDEQARAKLGQAYAAGRVPNVVFNLARVELLTGRSLEATRHFREYLPISDPRKVTPQEREKIDGWLKETAKQIARLDISAPAGASVLIDGEGVGIAPLSGAYDVAKGRHVVVAQLDTKKLRADVDAPPGEITRVLLQDDAAPAVPLVATGPAKDIVAPPREPEPSYWTATKVGGVAAWAVAVGGFVVGGLLLKDSGDKAADGRTATAGLPTCVGVSSAAYEQGASAASASTLGPAAPSRSSVLARSR